MVRGYLISESNGIEVGRVMIDKQATIGRMQGCEITISDPAASRRHVEITDHDGVFYWKDLGSTNGTMLNGVKMLEGMLKHGDTIEIGEAVIRFESEGIEDSVSSTEEKNAPLFAGTMLRSVSDVTAEPEQRDKTDELLSAVYTVMNEIATNFDPCDLVDRILETTMKAINAQRGAVFFAAENDEKLGPCKQCNHVHRIKDGKLLHIEADEIKISRTIARRVLKNGESVLYEDAASGISAAVSESIMALKLQSIICVPLSGKSGNLGVLYIDSDRPSQQYAHEDMLLATAVGNSAGLAIENAMMHREILDKQRIEQDIMNAWTIQEGFLVKEWPENNPNFEVYGQTFPAKTVGGDFYDFVTTAEGKVGILIGDVSGKGVPAALTMAQLIAEFRVHAQNICSPADILKTLNEAFVQRSQRGTFCTMCYLCLDIKTGKVCCANAGHNPVVVISKENTDLRGEASGPPLGILPNSKWENTNFDIMPGDTVLLYTDGISEARRSNGVVNSESPNEYGLDTLQRFVLKLTDQSPKSMLGAINANVRAFCAPDLPHDDCTMIALKYLG